MSARTPLAVFILASPLAPRRLLQGQCRRFKREGRRVAVIASPGRDFEEFGCSEGIETFSVPIERSPAPLRDFVSLARIWLLLRRLRPAIVEAGTPKAGLLGMLAAWLANVPVRVYALHGLRLETAVGLRRRLLWCAERLTCLTASRVLCVGRELRSEGAALGLFAEDEADVLGTGGANGVDLDHFRPVTRPASSPPTIGFVGRLTRDKGIEELLAAFDLVRRRLPGARLIALGCHEEGDRLPAAVRRRLEDDPAIETPGFVDDPAPYYSRMDVVALPTRREGLPLVLMEAAASGRPVVAMRATGVAEAVEDGETGLLVDIGDVRGMAAALIDLLADPKKGERIGRAARRRAEKLFDRREANARKAGFFRRLLEEEAPAGAAIGRAFRRGLDLAAAVAGLLLASPVLALSAAAIRLTMGSPVLYRQPRVGLLGTIFTIWKLRTMSPTGGGPGGPITDEERVTPLGRFLRRTGIDELPQLWNVLRGDMSIVGPRPLIDETLRHFPRQRRKRQAVKPGLTGWAQIQGRNEVGWEEKIELDLWYVDNKSLLLDLRIMLRTLPLLFGEAGRAAAQPIPTLEADYETARPAAPRG